MTAKINENGKNIKNKNIGNLCRDNNDFKMDYGPRTDRVKLRRVILLQTSTVFV